MTTSLLANQVYRHPTKLRVVRSSEVAPNSIENKVVLADPAMKALEQTLRRVAPACVNVLIVGETGVGKDVFATLLHELSNRADKPFLSLNCAALPEALLEGELFGYERGAYTGAATSK